MTPKEELEHTKKLERIVESIRKHCPNLAKNHPDGIESFANHILVCHENSRNALGQSEDVLRIEQLKKHVRKASGLLTELSDTSKRKLNYAIPPLENEIRAQFGSLEIGPSLTSNNGMFDRRAEELQSLLTGLEALRSEPSFKNPASNKLNYEAAVVAAACRKLWREEKAGAEPPKEIRHDRKHPMGNFIEDTFDILVIGASASSALSSLKKLGGERAVILSVELG